MHVKGKKTFTASHFKVTQSTCMCFRTFSQNSEQNSYLEIFCIQAFKTLPYVTYVFKSVTQACVNLLDVIKSSDICIWYYHTSIEDVFFFPCPTHMNRDFASICAKAHVGT